MMKQQHSRQQQQQRHQQRPAAGAASTPSPTTAAQSNTSSIASSITSSITSSNTSSNGAVVAALGLVSRWWSTEVPWRQRDGPDVQAMPWKPMRMGLAMMSVRGRCERCRRRQRDDVGASDHHHHHVVGCCSFTDPHDLYIHSPPPPSGPPTARQATLDGLVTAGGAIWSLFLVGGYVFCDDGCESARERVTEWPLGLCSLSVSVLDHSVA